MSNVVDVPEDDDHGKKAVDEANQVIESAASNVMIEIEMAKAIRVGVMLRQWRSVMLEESTTPGRGMPFPVEWVDECAMNIFLRFFPSLEVMSQYETESYESESEEDDE